MKITRRQLRRIVETFAATAEEEALKVNKEAGISLVTDQAFWDERGISTGEELAKHLLASTYSDYYKDLHGIRPRWMADKIKTMSVEEIQTLIDDLDKEAEVMAADEKWEEENLPGWEDEMMAAVKANPEDIPSEYLEYETLPQQTGMGRRTEGIMRITRRQLRRIIREAIDPREMEEPVGGWVGDALKNDPDFASDNDTDDIPQAVGDLVRTFDFVGDGWGGDYEKVVGDQVGQVIEIEDDIDGAQFTVLFPDGTKIMDNAMAFEMAR